MALSPPWIKLIMFVARWGFAIWNMACSGVTPAGRRPARLSATVGIVFCCWVLGLESGNGNGMNEEREREHGE